MKRKMSCLIVVLILSFSTCLTVSATSKYLTMDGIRWQAQKKQNGAGLHVQEMRLDMNILKKEKLDGSHKIVLLKKFMVVK